MYRSAGRQIQYENSWCRRFEIAGAALLLFVPAAEQSNFPLFLGAVFIIGAGVTALQTAANPYGVILGPEHSAPVRLTLEQAFNSIGAAIAPLVAGAFILTDPAKLVSKASIADTVKVPYLLIRSAFLSSGYRTFAVRVPGNPMSPSGLTWLNSTPFGTSRAFQT